jgi:adenosylcobyric acid synthase
VAPFKAQNMALNSAATADGGEIGRAQALQAEACRIPATVDMNPILIKPSSDTGAQVVVCGRVWGQVTARDYHQRRVEDLFPLVLECYQRLAAAHDIVVIEGAGSPAEINLKAHDIVNMRMAAAADAASLLRSSGRWRSWIIMSVSGCAASSSTNFAAIPTCSRPASR